MSVESIFAWILAFVGGIVLLALRDRESEARIRAIVREEIAAERVAQGAGLYRHTAILEELEAGAEATLKTPVRPHPSLRPQLHGGTRE